MATRNYLIDIELYRAVASPPRPSQNDQAASDAFLGQLLESRQIRNHEIMSYKTPIGNTMLHVTSLKGNHHVVKSILARVSGSISEKNSKLETALHMAATNGCMQVVEALLGKSENDTSLSRALNLRGNTAAHEALINGYHATVKTLVEYDPEISTFLNHEKKSLFYIAVEQGTEQAVQLVNDMLEKADVSKLNEGKPMLYPAIKGKNQEMIDCILNKAPNIMHRKDDDKGRTVLHYAASIGYFAGVDNFINKDSSCVMARDKGGLFAVHLAARNGHIKILERLLDKTHSPDLEELVTNKGRSILHEAANYGKHGMVKHILGAPSLPSLINMQDDDGNTPLHLATMNSKPMTASIMARDANVNLKIANGDGKTVFDVAQDENHKHPYKFQTLLTWGAILFVFPRGIIWGAILFVFPGGIIASEYWNDVDSDEEQREDPHLSDSRKMNVYKDKANTLTLVATLIATVTFAAGFTVPGGYDQNSGISILLHKKMFALFIICNSWALYSSITAVVTLLWAQIGEDDMVGPMLASAHPRLVWALLMMMLAFMAGSYATISKLTWLGILVLGIGGANLVETLMLLLPLSVHRIGMAI